jgi:hypothetical protein
MGVREEKVRKFWGGGLGGNVCSVAWVLFSVYYGRLWYEEITNKFSYPSVRQRISLILSLFSNLET